MLNNIVNWSKDGNVNVIPAENNNGAIGDKIQNLQGVKVNLAVRFISWAQ